MDNQAPLAAQANTLAKQGQWQQASDKLALLIAQITGHTVQTIQINRDQYSLNSLNGFTQLDTDEALFFKYHHEEGEEKSIEEYYRAELLRNYGFPVDLPLYACKEPGRQLLLYRKRHTERFADVCRRWEAHPDATTLPKLIKAQQQLDQLTLTKARNSLHRVSVQQVKQEAIHQLFYHRLVDDHHPLGLGGRVAKFYLDKTIKLGQQSLDWSQFSRYRWQINGIHYPFTVAELFSQSAQRLAPQSLADHGAIVAHGDAHNANVWFEDEQTLTLFDPAFAGENIPALLAEIKATFHNIFAHPYWLYEPDIAQEHYQVEVRIDHPTQQIVVQHNWQLTDLRQAFLDSKINNYWRPLIAQLKAQQSLPEHYQQVIQLALFCCPTLVLDLTANGYGQHNQQSSALGWAIAVALGNGGQGPGQWISQLL
ncbi:hypothetical protein EV690_1497 [Celerinatantimonas diazotrophica]|uniref:Phosphotransferase family enzyme n=2 Tax=Celerinatantimonas diazotrophica TaxID=412034 RepID=A0A4V2PR81_9GAMM|nr:hypothetical protein EV690_1497 [Celerinatantimonas diazotrophica]CAG9298135.1 hypothetical protein CEDIAZO_03330 [Celerinatantimonas diazotrophica]